MLNKEHWMYTISKLITELIRIQDSLVPIEDERGEHVRGSYKFIPNHAPDVVQCFLKATYILCRETLWTRSKNSLRFLDVGCGFGNIMLLAKATSLANEIHGLEHNVSNVRAAKRLLGVKRGKESIYKVIKGNALKFNGYGNYDIIYFYQPFQDYELAKQFERRLIHQMQVGAAVIPFLPNYIGEKPDERLKNVGPRIFLKVQEEEQCTPN
ncbi:MAG: methyltransferase [Desulfobacteraceae bacterium]|jgi:hypothetical protein